MNRRGREHGVTVNMALDQFRRVWGFRQGLRPPRTKQLDWIEAADNYVNLH
jgi:hypothetical protein